MLNKYLFLTVVEGEFCKFIIYKICVSNQSLTFMKQKSNLVDFATLEDCELMSWMSSHNIGCIS